jgi:MFS family permease
MTHDPYGALRQRDYRRLLLGSILSSLGTQVQATAIGWELYERTRSAEALGYVGLVQFVPVLLLSLSAGQVVDRHSRKGVLMVAQSFMAAAGLALALLSMQQGPVGMIYLCLLVVGISRAFSAPARWALVPQVVPPHELANAVTWNSSGWQIASVVGPALAGLLIFVQQTYLGEGTEAWLAYLLASLCSVGCIALVSTIAPRREERLPEQRSLDSLLAGVRFVWNTKVILATITLDLFAVLFGGATALLPVFARDILLVGPEGYGWLSAAPSLGALAMALALAHRRPFRRAGAALLWSVAGFGAAWIVFGLSQHYLLSFAMLLVAGALDNISIVVRGTLVQVLAPDGLRGRVAAVNSIFIGSSNELGTYESGLTAEWFGPVPSVVGGGIASIAVVLLVLARWPELRRLGSLHAAAPPTVAAVDAPPSSEPQPEARL